MFIFDCPYGLNVAPWDVAPTPVELSALFKQFGALNDGEHCVVVFFHGHKEAHNVHKAFEEAGFKQTIPFAWVKPNHTAAGPKNSLVTSFETGAMAYKEHRGTVPWFISENPTERPNVWHEESVSTMFKHENGDVVNPCQKPTALISKIVAMHCPKDSNLLVVGFGSGSEILGGLDAGVNVFACERDAIQFKATGRRLTMLINKEHERIEEEKRAGTNPPQKPNKKQKVDHPAPEEKLDKPVTPKQVIAVTKKCPNCGKMVEHPESAVCAHEECEALSFHATCVNFVNGQLWCRRHTPTISNGTAE